MKPLITLLIPCLVAINSSAQTFYYYQGKKIPLEVSSKKLLVKFSDNATTAQKTTALAKSSTLLTSEFEKLAIQPDFQIIKIESGGKNAVLSTTGLLNKDKTVLVANPMYIYSDSSEVGITQEFIVKLKSPSDFASLEKLAKQTNTKIARQNEFVPSVYILEADKNANGNAIEMANFFHEQNIFEFAEPNFIRSKVLHTNDPYFGDQWSLQNTGQYGGTAGADMSVINAWNITMGKPTIKIAIVDEGVDLLHPDLTGNLALGYDATGNGSNGAPSGNDAHGTACAGIVGAKANNSIGISGVAPNCKIVPVRISIGGYFSDDRTADGINWAWMPSKGAADVISCSWGGGTPSSLVTGAINNATMSGRGGLGSVVLCSSGNENSSVSYPANLPNVIAVGAMSMCNQRKHPSSCDNESWGSNYGAEIAFVTPGVNISTTDISGPNGYNSNPNMGAYENNYIRKFNGTSSACPNAAGVAALVLSVNRCLSYTEVRKILALSCDKVGGYCYNSNPSQPNGTWNNQMGHGRLNAYNAVRYAFTNTNNNYANITGADMGASGLFGWTLITGGCSNLAAANYFVKRHEIRANVTFPYTPSPIIIGTSNGFSAGSPNDGNYYLGVSNLGTTSATLSTYVYETMTIQGVSLGYVPANPSYVRFNYSVMGSATQDQYLQNQNVTSTQTFNAMNRVSAGYNVTSSTANGNYVIKPGGNVTLRAGNTILFADGFISESGSTLVAYTERFFTCTSYPNGRLDNSNDEYPAVVQNFTVTKLDESEISMESSPQIKNYPNPFTNSTTIEYFINESQSVKISIRNQEGKEVLQLKNVAKHATGTYQVQLEGIDLPAGIYLCTLETETNKMTKELVKLK